MWTNESYPADAVSLRSISSDNFVVVDTTRETRVIGETDFTSGPGTLHPKAIYIVEGQLYQVERLDFEGRKAFVREIDCDYYTTAITNARVTILDTFADDGQRANGEVHVVSRVVGFKKIKFYTNENVGSGELDLPEQQMHTTSYWLTIPAATMGMLPFAVDERRDGVVGLAYAIRQVAQLLLMCDSHDIGISIDMESAPAESECSNPAIEFATTETTEGTELPGKNVSVNSVISVVGHVVDEESADLHLRQLPGRHRLQRAAVPHARRTAVGHAPAHCGMRMRKADVRAVSGRSATPVPWRRSAALRILDLLMAQHRTADIADGTETTLEHAG